MAIGIMSATVAGCAGQPTQMGGLARNVNSEEALVMPPPGGPSIIDIVERRYDNGIEQDISLFTTASTPGQNTLHVRFYGTAKPFSYGDNSMTYRAITESRISTEMRSALPGVPMAKSPILVQNGFGPFGYAFGRSRTGDLCMFGWQQISAAKGTVSPLQNTGSIQIRARICQAGATEESMLAFMYGFTISGSVDDMKWNPYGAPLPAPQGLGRTGSPIYPAGMTTGTIVPVLGQPPVQSALAEQQPRPRRVSVPVAGSAVLPSQPALLSNPSVVVPSPVSPSMGSITPASPPVVSPAAPRGPVASVPLVPSPSASTGSMPSATLPAAASPAGTAIRSPSVADGRPGVVVPSPPCAADAVRGSTGTCP